MLNICAKGARFGDHIGVCNVAYGEDCITRIGIMIVWGEPMTKDEADDALTQAQKLTVMRTGKWEPTHAPEPA